MLILKLVIQNNIQVMLTGCILKERDIGDEYGWKQVHGDVFRPASFPVVFSSLIGVGHQIAFVSLCTICFAIIGELYTE